MIDNKFNKVISRLAQVVPCGGGIFDTLPVLESKLESTLWLPPEPESGIPPQGVVDSWAQFQTDILPQLWKGLTRYIAGVYEHFLGHWYIYCPWHNGRHPQGEPEEDTSWADTKIRSGEYPYLGSYKVRGPCVLEDTRINSLLLFRIWRRREVTDLRSVPEECRRALQAEAALIRKLARDEKDARKHQVMVPALKMSAAWPDLQQQYAYPERQWQFQQLKLAWRPQRR